MTCNICGCASVLHGAHLGGRPGTYLAESGCHNGVWMDDDEYTEGWDPSVVTRPCPNNPDCCLSCNGTGDTSDDPEFLVECEACEGTGWAGGDWRAPDDRYGARLSGAQRSELSQSAPDEPSPLPIPQGEEP